MHATPEGIRLFITLCQLYAHMERAVRRVARDAYQRGYDKGCDDGYEGSLYADEES